MASSFFSYRRGKKVEEIIGLVALVFLIGILWASAASDLTKILLSIFFSIILILIIRSAYSLNKNFEIGPKSIRINKKFGPAKKIGFQEIPRITIREEKSSYGGNYLAMTIFEKSAHTRIIVSDLDHPAKLINLLEQRGKEFGFNVIHQNLSGKVIKAIKK